MKPYPELSSPNPYSGNAEEFVAYHCDLLRQHFENGEAAALIDAYLVSVGHGYTPPSWVLLRLAHVFFELHRSEGAKSLDDLLGMKAAGRGKKHPLKVRKHLDKRRERAGEIHILVALLKISPEDAAYMVISREEIEGSDDLPAVEWLVEDYRRHWRDRLAPLDFLASFIGPRKHLTLSQYPDWSFPAGLK